MFSIRYVCASVKPFGARQCVWLLMVFEFFGSGSALQAAQQQKHKRTPTELDAIRMTRIAGRGSIISYAGTLTEDFAYFSPDRQQFVVVLKKGNLESNTNDYSLLVFKTQESFDGTKPRVLVSMSSSSNREAITDVSWLSDNDTILFRGENPGESSQLYSVSAKSGALRKLTHHPTNLIQFSSDARGKTIVFAAERAKTPVLTANAEREGVTVSGEDMSELILGERSDLDCDLFVLDTATGKSRPLPLPPELDGQLYGDFLNFSLSPDGSQLVASLNLLEVPPSWHEYSEPTLATILKRKLPTGSLSWVFRYVVIDTESGKGRILLDAPVSYHGSEVVWSRDSKSLILTGVFLPIDKASPNGKDLAHSSVVAIRLKTLEFSVLSDEDLRFVRKNGDGSVLAFATRQRSSSRIAPEPRYFRKTQTGWVPTGALPEELPSIVVAAEQDLNSPPKIVISDTRSGRKALVLDLNPQLQDIQFGRVEEIRFIGALGKEVRAGLYFPVGYVSGRKYPLVVQTHGFDPKSFWIDGSFTTAFAAQALAGQGFLVLQVPDIHDWDETTSEAPNMAETLERAVEYVDSLGCLDRDRLGIIGFSRTGLYTWYLLTRSKLHFGAAIVADGSDGGYSQYLQFLNAHQYTASDSEAINGGAPFGGGLLYWLRGSSEFFLDAVNTPLMLQVSAPENLGFMWAPYVGLKRLGKPVELIYSPNGAHIREKPWDRLVSEGGAVDWFVFWLQGKEDPDPAKAQEYERWQELRNLQRATKRGGEKARLP
jgi:dipeptidyl aminopeptidase/acylaminoacyl peptidase